MRLKVYCFESKAKADPGKEIKNIAKSDAKRARRKESGSKKEMKYTNNITLKTVQPSIVV